VAAVSSGASSPRSRRGSSASTRTTSAGGDGARSSTRSRARRSGGAKRRRAPQGANRERILAFLRESGPSSASGIAKGTGINRAVVYNNLGKMTEEGAAAKADDAGGTTLFRLP
jgi:DNA invertase Pin-like site-specific DNA recombinase